MASHRIPTPASISIARRLAAPALLALLAGCSLLGSPVPPGRSVEDVYDDTARGGGAKLKIEQDTGPGAGEKTKPVIYPPKVFAVWVAEHLDRERDMKIGAHWVFFKLRDSSWTEEPIDGEPEPTGDAGASDVARLKRLVADGKFGTILLPYRGADERTPTSDLGKEKTKKEESEFDTDGTTTGDRP